MGPPWLGFMDHVRSLPLCDQMVWLRILVFVLFVCPIIFFCILLVAAGRRTLKYGQVPWPGALVWDRTRVRRGGWVLAHAYGHFVMVPIVITLWSAFLLAFDVPDIYFCPVMAPNPAVWTSPEMQASSQ